MNTPSRWYVEYNATPGNEYSWESKGEYFNGGTARLYVKKHMKEVGDSNPKHWRVVGRYA